MLYIKLVYKTFFFINLYKYSVTDGIVVINKPYGIPIVNSKPKEDVPTKKNHKIVGEVNYSIQDIMPFLTKELDVPALIPCIGAEKYTEYIHFYYL